jgi:Mrp family chromosome partitioning ATPase
VVAAALAVGLVVTGGVVARELLDQTLRVPARAAETTGLALAGAQPVATATGAPAFLPDVMRALDVGLGRRVLAHLPPDAYASVSDASDADGHNALDGHDADAPALVPVVSVQAGEGKTFVARRLAAHLARTGLAVGLLVPETDGEDIAAAAESPEGVTVRRYAVTDALPLARRLADLAADAPAAFAGCACVLVEWPALLGHAAPRRLLRRAALPLVVVRADRAWAAADRRAAADLAAACPVPPELVLNGVPLDRLDDLVGEVPRPRGRLRRLAKRLARLAFSRPSLPSPSSTPS